MKQIIKKLNLRTLLGLALLVILLVDTLPINAKLPFLDKIELLTYDIRLRATMPNSISPEVVIVDIDEKSLGEIGRWPWSRDRMATLVTNLFNDYGIDMLGFDVVMSEPDYSSGLKQLEALGQSEFKNNPAYAAKLEKLRPELDYDDRLAKALKDQRVVLGYYWAAAGKPTGSLPAPTLLFSELNKGHNLRIENNPSYGANLKIFQDAAQFGGNFNPTVDSDGNVRRVPMMQRHGDGLYDSLSFAMVRKFMGSPKVIPKIEDGRGGYSAIEWIELQTSREQLTIPVDEDLNALVPYRGPAFSFKYISAADVIQKRAKMGDLVGKIVLIGTTAPGLQDLRATPVGAVYPGVEIHANLISGMLEGVTPIKERPPFAPIAEAGLMLLIGLLMVFLFPWSSPIRSSIASVVALVLVIAINFAAWHYQNWVLALAPAVLLVAGLYIVGMSLGYFTESKAKKQFTQLFGQYVPPELVVEMSKDPESYTMSGRRKELTVLFSDVRGFTTISEGMEPEALAQLMNEYLGAMTVVIRKHEGTLDKYIGDAIMAFWGAPVENANHARAAVLSAMEMLVALEELNKVLAARGVAAMKIGIGINTGPMTVGDMGSEIRLAYTVMGDAVNLGARLEGKTKDYGIALMVGQATMVAVPEVLFRELDCVQVKGKDEPITTYEPMGMVGQIPAALQAELDLWTAALAAYRRQDWDESERLIFEIQKTNPDHKLYHLYLERIADFRLNPPGPDWTGVMRFDTK